jgi:hypothetical protein
MATPSTAEPYSTQSGVGSVARSETERHVVAILRSFAPGLTAIFTVGVLASCASAGASNATIEVEGRLIQTMAGGSDAEGWILQTDAGVLPLELFTSASPRDATCVTVEVPDDFGQPSDPTEIFDALDALVQESGDALPVSGYC